MAILSILRLPFRIAKIPLSIVLLAVGLKHRRNFNLPVAGLDEAKAQSIFFALKRAASNQDEERVAQEWLSSLQIVQVASGRIMTELYYIDTNVQFWTKRLEEGGHFWFTLLRRGPSAFFHRLKELVLHPRRGDAHADTTQELQPRRTSAEVNAGELVEKRVLLLRLLRVQLCEAAAAVHRAGSLLYLQEERPTPGVADELFPRAEKAVHESMLSVTNAMAGLRRGVHATLDPQSGPQGTIATDRPMLAQALHKVLGISHLRRVWSQQKPQQSAEYDSVPQHARYGRFDEGSSEGRSPHALGVREEERSDLELSPEGGLPSSLEEGSALIAAQDAVDFVPVLSLDSSVHSALMEARKCTAMLQRTNRLVSLPEWLIMPSRAQRYWVQYTVAGLVIGYSTIFLVRHSRLMGSRDLEHWTQTAVDAARGAWVEHVIAPLDRLKGELFNTFRRRPAIVSMDEYEADRDSLQRMLEDFKSDYIRKRGAQAASNSSTRSGAVGLEMSSPNDVPPSGEELQGMELMMRSYEQGLKKPIRHLVSGDLMRSLLIQVQKLKVDTESAMLEIDQILHANELSISLVAAIPTFLIAGAALYGLGSVLTPAPPDPRREAVGAKLALIEVERSLEALASCEASVEAAESGTTAEAEGMLVYHLALAYSEAEELFKRHRGVFGSAGAAQWPNLRADLLELATPAPADQKLRTASRMMRNYTIYQQ